jgi:hypothetical protein
VTATEHGRHVRHAHGHPGWASGLRWWLKELGQLTAHMPAAWETPRAPSMPLAPHLSTLAGAYSFDRGGWLPRGLSLAWNGTSSPEPVGEAAGGTVNVHVYVNAPIGSRAELDNWFTQTFDRAARQGRLSWAMRQSFSAS